MNALAVDRMENGLHLMGWLMIARPWLRSGEDIHLQQLTSVSQRQEEDDHERARLIEDAHIAKEYAQRVLEWSSGQDNYNNSIKLILESVIQHTGMPMPVAIPHPPPPPPTYGAYHSADQSTVNARRSGSVVGAREENHAWTAAVGAGEENHGGIAAREENNGGIGVGEENPEESQNFSRHIWRAC